MIGIFDSGVGGINTLRHLRERMPRSNVIFLRDRANAPYGTKSTNELIEITERNIAELMSRGTHKVLIGCCTASSVFPLIDDSLRKNVIPIIEPVARAADRMSQNGIIALIATEATVRSDAFDRALPKRSLIKLAAQPLVELVESGERDGAVSKRSTHLIKELLSPLSDCGADTLILGCTHFSALRKQISHIATDLGITHIADSARAGADALYASLCGVDEGDGLTDYLTT